MPKKYRFQSWAFLKFRKISKILSAVLADWLCRIPALRSFVESFEESLQVFFKNGSMFPKVAGKFPKKKKILAAYKNSNIFYKIFYADAGTSKWPFFYFNEKLL